MTVFARSGLHLTTRHQPRIANIVLPDRGDAGLVYP